jgi:hypothetical protein
MPKYPAPLCMRCAHFNEEDLAKLSCRAFPRGIPKAILHSDHDHQAPYKGDRGITFRERRPPA